jgi:hypothetical protein
MTWAAGRRLIVFAVFAAMLLVLATIAYYTFFYQAPSCKDGAQDGSETGLDCGGSCPYLCASDEEGPTVLFTKALLNGEGRTDVIALVENKNTAAAAKDIPYTLTVYGYDQSLIQTVSGILELPPGATVPLFVTGIASGSATPGASFLTIDGEKVLWYPLAEDPRVLPKVSDIVLTGASTTPRITATLANSDVVAMRNVRAIALVRDGSGNAIAASATLLSSIPASGQATATFTWNAPFPGAAVSILVLPVIPLP